MPLKCQQKKTVDSDRETKWRAPQLSTMKMRELNEKSAPHLSSRKEESDVQVDRKKAPLKCQQVKVALEREASATCAPQVSTNHLTRTRAAMHE